MVEQRLKSFNIPFKKAEVQEGGVRVTQVRTFGQPSSSYVSETDLKPGRLMAQVHKWVDVFSIRVLWGG